MGEQGTEVEVQVRQLTGADGGQGMLSVSAAKDTQQLEYPEIGATTVEVEMAGQGRGRQRQEERGMPAARQGGWASGNEAMATTRTRRGYSTRREVGGRRWLGAKGTTRR